MSSGADTLITPALHQIGFDTCHPGTRVILSPIPVILSD